MGQELPHQLTMTNNQTTQQHVLLVEFHIQTQFVADFEQAILSNAAASLQNEPGCRRFDVCRDPEQPAAFILYEIYDDQAAIDAHLQSAHYRNFDASTRDWVEQKTVQKLLLVPPGIDG